jgi:hypothetical protein
MGFEMKGRRGGPRKGAGRKPEQEGEPRRNRVVVLLTDAEFARGSTSNDCYSWRHRDYVGEC